MDDDSTPMTRTELAMLWDLLNRWVASHPAPNRDGWRGATFLRGIIDAELTDRFGG